MFAKLILMPHWLTKTGEWSLCHLLMPALHYVPSLLWVAAWQFMSIWDKLGATHSHSLGWQCREDWQKFGFLLHDTSVKDCGKKTSTMSLLFPQVGFHGLLSGKGCGACNCNQSGSTSVACDEEGRCQCVTGVAGDKCDRCQKGYYNFQDGGCTRKTHTLTTLTHWPWTNWYSLWIKMSTKCINVNVY